MKDWASVIGGTLAVLFGVGFAGLLVWYDYRYPCVQYQAVFVPQWTETQTHYIECGEGCLLPVSIDVNHPAHWEQRCLARGDRHKGDVQAAYAPIPAERSW